MTVRHLPRLDPERWYVIDTDHTRDQPGRPSWQEHKVSFHADPWKTEASISWNVLGRHGFGLGFQFGRNGDESDLGLDLYAGRLTSLWFRLRAPWLKWARVSKDRDPEGWYNARHTGARLFYYRGNLAQIEMDTWEHTSADPPGWWRGSWSLHWSDIVGRDRCETTEGETGECLIPLPEGSYRATWKQEIRVWRYVRWPGRLRDVVFGPRRRVDYWIEVDGGIPHEGKGESDYDCGMDGLFGCGGRSLEAAIGNAVTHTLRDRKRYGGPHDLTRPMTVREAEQRNRA